MNIHPTFTNVRSHIEYKFSELRMHALRNVFWSRLIGKSSGLATFSHELQHGNFSRKLIGVKDIRIDQIIGTLNRNCDFDQQFRPLGKHLLLRWVNTFLNLERDGWSPIVVHKVGGQYYVEDGHHRVSVARSVGMMFIEAKVWEYHAQPKQIENCQLMKCTEISSSKVYATG